MIAEPSVRPVAAASILFHGNCQAQALSNVYADLLAPGLGHAVHRVDAWSV